MQGILIATVAAFVASWAAIVQATETTAASAEGEALIHSACRVPRRGSVASNCHSRMNGSTSARIGSVPGFNLRKHQRRLS